MLKKINEDSQILKLVVIYCLIYGCFVLKMFFYANQEITGPDWRAHASYLIYEVEHQNQIIPEFENIKIYSIKNIFYENGEQIYQMEKADNATTCYLGHSPLYYKIVGLFNVVEIEGKNVFLNFTRIGQINIFITAISMLIMLYEGYKYLVKKEADMLGHTLFATIATTIPLYGFLGSQLNNDNLCNLGIALLMIGIFSYMENGYTIKTYLFVALGVAVSMFAKLTAGLIVLIVVVLIVVLDIYKRKGIDIVCNKFFICSIPIYLFVIYYYIKIYLIYGSFQPSLDIVASYDYFNSNFYIAPELRGDILSLWQYIVMFFKEIVKTWVSTYSHGWMITREDLLSIPYAVTIILCFVQCIADAKKVFLKKNDSDVLCISFSIALIITLIIHVYRQYNGYLISGYTGGAQSRYYMPCIPVIALGASRCFMLFKAGKRQVVNKCINFAFVIMIIALLYADFGYYITNCYRLAYFY